jgi:multidrug efflux system membrane fusion protein
MDGRTTALDRADGVQARQTGRRPGRTTGKLVFRLVIMGVLLVVVFGGFYGYERFRENMTAQFFATMKPPPVPVVAVAAAAQSVPQIFAAIGSLAAVHQVTVAPEIGGRVTKIFFDAGATVHAGDPLVQLNDDPERGDLANFQAQARLSQINLLRAKELASRGNGPQVNVDTNQSQLDQANAEIAKTQALIAQKLIRAPFSGVIGIRQIDLGQYVTPGAAVVSLTDLDTLYVNFTLPEQNRGQLFVGQTAVVVVDAYDRRKFPAVLATIEPQVGTDTRTIKLQATLANPEHLLMPGMYAHVHVVRPSLPDVVTVPETAVEYTLYGDSVFVVTEDAAAPPPAAGQPAASPPAASPPAAGQAAPAGPKLKVKRTFVKAGEHFDNKVAILEGLKAGDRVATSGQIKLTDGAAVVLTDSDALATPAAVPTN